jgi:hypothetical protein
MQNWKCRQCGKESSSYGDKPDGKAGGNCTHSRIIAYKRQYEPNYRVPSNYTTHQWVRIEDYDYHEFDLDTKEEMDLLIKLRLEEDPKKKKKWWGLF